MNSALYSGWVQHQRFSPRPHQFRYRMGLLFLDLDEQQQVLALSPLAGRGRWAPFAFRETDYLPTHTGAGKGLADSVRQLVSEALGQPVLGKVCLLTQPRSWGLAFNPASFFYCYDSIGQLQAVLCEVSNTPWRERYHYVLPFEGEVRVDKAFHVSPFLPRDVEYRMRLTEPGERLAVQMADWQHGHKLFEAGLNLQRQPLSRTSLHRYLLTFPWMTGKTLLAIYWQALRLLLKRTPLFNHQAAKGTQRVATVTRPATRQEVAHEEP